MTNKLNENLFIELGASLSSNYPIRNIIVENTLEVIEKHRQKYKNTDVFATVLQYDNADIRNANQKGSLYFDLDGETAQEDTKILLTFLQSQGCLEKSMRLYYSGNKGFHVEVPFEALGIQPDKELNKIFGNIVRNIKEKCNLSSIDTAIYDQVRLWRLPNSINSKSRLYKIPLYLEEIHVSIEGIREMARSQRIDVIYEEPEAWTKFAEIYEKAKSMQLQVYEAKEPLQLKDAVGLEKGSRDNKMLKLAESLLSRSYNKQDVWETMSQVNQTYQPPLDDSSMNRIFRQATNYISAQNSPATKDNTKRGSNEMSQETRLESEPATNGTNTTVSQVKDDDIPIPILLSELSMEKNQLEWIWDGFIARGHKTLFSALWKAGKSTFIGLLLKAIQHGELYAGQKTIFCNVLVLSEESHSQWVERREELELQSNIYILSNPLKMKPSYRDWIRWLENIKKFCKENEIGLVIIDTISEFWSVNDENKAPEVTQALMPLNYLTEDNVAVLLVHHFRKSGGTQGTAARGSGALGSKVDILIDFTRYNEEEQTTKRKLTCLSRFDETPREIVLDYVNGDYVVLGSSADVHKNEKLASMLSIFAGYPNGFTAKEVWENWDTFDHGKKPSKRTIQRHIADLIETNQVEKSEDKEISGKLVPFYKVIDPRQNTSITTQNTLSQVNEAETTNEAQLSEPEITHDKTTNTIHASENVAGNLKPCFCGSSKFWEPQSGNIVCAVCHPPLKDERSG